MNTMTIDEYHAALNAQGIKDRAELVMICPMCGTQQTGNDMIAAGAGKTFDDVEEYLGFSCVGRFTGAGSPREKQDGKPCNWTLGGLLRMHTLEVVTPDGARHPRFEVATPEQIMSERSESLESAGYPKLHPAHYLSSCDYCDCKEDGGHYCLLHSMQIKNMDTVACDDWTKKANNVISRSNKNGGSK